MDNFFCRRGFKAPRVICATVPLVTATGYYEVRSNMKATDKPRIIYILPHYDPATSSHFFHLYEFLELAAKELDIFLVIEKAAARPAFGMPFYCQRFLFPPLRSLELLCVLARERWRGRENFYAHYSLYGAVVSWFVVRLFGGRVYYWNAGMPWLYRRSLLAEGMLRFILRRTLLVTGTKNLAQEYCRRYGLWDDGVRIMPNWVNIRRFATGLSREESRRDLGIPAEARVVLFVHRLSRRKGAQRIPEIAAEVTKQEKGVMFIVVGGGPEAESLKFKVQSLKLGPRVWLVGEVPHRDIPVYFRCADILLMPSEEEGLPHVLLEAQASGLPYVASDVGGVREITPPVLREYLVPSDAAHLFSQNIEKLLGLDSLERLRIGREMGAWVRQYDLPEAVPRFRKLFSP